MLSPTDRKLLAILLSRQEETGAAAELPSERVAEIASGSPPDADETAALLASPLARDELILHRRIRRLQRVTTPRNESTEGDRSFPSSGVAGRLPRGSPPPFGGPREDPDPFGFEADPPEDGLPPLVGLPPSDGPRENPDPSGFDAGPKDDLLDMGFGGLSPSGPGGVIRGSSPDNLLFPRPITPARAKAKPAGNTGWVGMLLRLWRRLGGRKSDLPSGKNIGHARREPLEFDGPWASLLVELKPDNDASYLLTLRLRPEVPGGPAGRALEVREPHPGGLVWLTGRTDGAGLLQAVWVHSDLRPHDRPLASGLRINGVESKY